MQSYKQIIKTAITMKKITIYALSALILGTSTLSSCSFTSTNNYMGTMAGAEIGGVVGEALGWMTTSRHGGPGKAMLGSVVGTVAGAVIGNAVTNDNNRAERRAAKERRRLEADAADYQRNGGGSECLSNNGTLYISNVTFEDEDGDGKCSRNETLNVIYEITNCSETTLTDVVLSIDAPAANRNFALSPSNTVTIKSGETIKYKAKAFLKSKTQESYTTIYVYADSQTGGKVGSSLRVRTR